MCFLKEKKQMTSETMIFETISGKVILMRDGKKNLFLCIGNIESPSKFPAPW
jgi:hypothetical protein